MKFLFRLLKNKLFWQIFGFILLSLLTIVVGYFFDWSFERQILTLIIIILLFALGILYQQFKISKGAGQIEESLKDSIGLSPSKNEEINQLKEKLINTIDALKKSKLSKGINGKAALYALPWYMFIGPPGAGKTTAIENSSLEFPFGSDRIKGVGGTRNCDWFFSKSAIFLDTAGRYTSEEVEDQQEWFAFLDILRKYRKKKPINGVIVGISINELLTYNLEDLEKNATLIRKRIDELILKLGVRFPVYLLFTKCDLLEGFVDFFGNFNRKQRGQIWGCTLNSQKQNDPDREQVIKEELNKLQKSMEIQRINCLNNPLKRDQRKRVFVFPLQFAAAGETISKFISRLFTTNPYQENPNFRGFYFTSGTQEGVPIDKVIKEIAGEFNFTPERIKHFDPEMEKKSYFIRDVFIDVIIKDQNQVSHTSRFSRQRALFKLGMLTCILITLLLSIIYITQNFLRNNSDILSTRGIAEQNAPFEWNNNSYFQNFKNLDKLKRQITHLQNQPFLSGSIYQGDYVAQSLKKLFLKRIFPFIINDLYTGLIYKKLTDYNNNSYVRRDEAYELLRAYLLLDSDYKELKESSDEKYFLENKLTSLTDTLLNNKFNFEAQASYNEKLESASELIKQQVKFFVQIFSSEENLASPFASSDYLIERVREKLGNPNIADIYSRVKHQAIGQLTSLNLEEILSQNSNLFEENVSISRIFTREGWENIVEKAIDNASENPAQYDWVLNINQSSLPEELSNENIKREKLKELYFKDYVKAWKSFLRKIEIRSFQTIDMAVQNLKVLGDMEESPLKILIKRISAETKFEGQIESQLEQLTGKEISQHLVDNSFINIHNLINSESSNIDNLIYEYVILANVIEMLDQESDQQYADFAKKVVEGSSEINVALNKIKDNLEKYNIRIHKNIFEKPVIDTWRIIIRKTDRYLNSLWNNDVMSVYNSALMGNYPLNKSGTTEVSLSDLADFFRSNDGIFWKFVKTDMEPYINVNLSPKKWQGVGINISNTFRNTVHKAEIITKGLGLSDHNQIQLAFRIRPDFPSPNASISRYLLVIDGNPLDYAMGGANWYNFNWPGNLGSMGASIEIRSQSDSYQPINYNTVWGWFRLLDKANIQRRSSTEFGIEWHFSSAFGGNVIARFTLLSESIYNPFENDDFFNIHLPQSLY